MPLHKVGNELFLTRILPRRGHHFVRLTGTWHGSREDDEDYDDDDDRRFPDFDAISRNFIKALPLLINLTQLHTPDLVPLVRRDRRQEAAMRKKKGKLESQEAGKDGMLGLLQRAESIGHPNLKATDILGLFKHVNGASLRALEFTSRRGSAEQGHLASILEQFSGLETLKIHLKIYDCRGGIHPVLRVNPAYTSWMPRPKLRKLALTGTYEHFQFPSNFFRSPYDLEFQPSFAPLLNYAQHFAETLDVLALEIRNADDEFDSDHDEDDEDDEEWTGECNSRDYDPTEFGLNLTIPFAVLRRVALRATRDAIGARLYLIDTTKFPSLKSCLCDISPANSDGAIPDFDYARDRIPGLKVATTSGKVDSLTRRVTRWIRQRDAEQAPERDDYCDKPTWPQPLRHLPEKPDPVALSERLRHTVEHLNEWYRHASDAQDSDALVQIREALESVDIRKTVIEAWAGSPDSGDA